MTKFHSLKFSYAIEELILYGISLTSVVDIIIIDEKIHLPDDINFAYNSENAD
ncbi:hypothetical protein NSMS1_48050 [Nostoc sp. MS1]|nr:hypothetical protein NSMS1_48050 [Nostoc sp. MS1]